MGPETVRHCPGCKGYTHGWQEDCAGFEVSGELGQFTVPDVVPSLPFADRIKVLFGWPVFLGTRAGPLGEPFEVADLMDDQDTDPGWRDRHPMRDAG